MKDIRDRVEPYLGASGDGIGNTRLRSLGQRAATSTLGTWMHEN